MKTVCLDRDFTFKPKRTVHISYKGGITYHRVPEAAARAIIAAGAGKAIEMEMTEGE